MDAHFDVMFTSSSDGFPVTKNYSARNK